MIETVKLSGNIIEKCSDDNHLNVYVVSCALKSRAHETNVYVATSSKVKIMSNRKCLPKQSKLRK